ncbi:MAG TPA: TatD family hydrolase, partial [Methylomirabilota bacterium]|nr:TatD family hydrolase [Methylomirabilota bacterium]
IGLDRWKPGLAYDGQEEVFVEQLRLAAERNRPVSIHCLRAWGRLEELLRAGPRPERGFLLHSYGGPVEMVKPLTRLGAYFSFPGYYLHERKAHQRETFRHVPPERLLIETDAPDQLLPEPPPAPSGEPETPRFVIDPATGRQWNHPASLRAVCEGLATFLGQPVETLAARIEENFLRLFGAGGRSP